MQPAAETPHGGADFRGLVTKITGTGRQRQASWDEIEVDRCVGGLLLVPSSDVVEEAVPEGRRSGLFEVAGPGTRSQPFVPGGT